MDALIILIQIRCINVLKILSFEYLRIEKLLLSILEISSMCKFLNFIEL